MLLALVGVTGIGKSYFKDKIVSNLGFEKVNTIRTRKMRVGEVNGKSGIFVTEHELDELKKRGKIGYDFKVFNGRYAYKKDEIFSKKNMVFEMHYTMIDDWKKIRPDIKTIYILPKNIEDPKQKARERNLSKEQEIERIKEIDEQYNNIINNKELREKFDYIIYNNYDKDSEEKLLNLVKEIKQNEEYMESKFFKIDDDFKTIISKALTNVKINSMKLIPTGWTNIVYEVETECGDYFFRFPRDEFWSRTIVKDYEFAKFIYKKTDFNTIKLELMYDNRRPFSMHKKIPGTPLAEKMNNLSKEEIKNIADEIAKFMYELHEIKYNPNEIFTVKNIGLELPEFLNELLEVHIKDENRKFWSINPISDNEKCLVHGDLNSSNILLDDNNHVAAIIDFGFAGFGNKYDDISRIIGRCPNTFKDDIVKSYESYSKFKLDDTMLNKTIQTWNNIDQSYINYMESIGIYKRN